MRPEDHIHLENVDVFERIISNVEDVGSELVSSEDGASLFGKHDEQQLWEMHPQSRSLLSVVK